MVQTLKNQYSGIALYLLFIIKIFVITAGQISAEGELLANLHNSTIDKNLKTNRAPVSTGVSYAGLKTLQIPEYITRKAEEILLLQTSTKEKKDRITLTIERFFHTAGYPYVQVKQVLIKGEEEPGVVIEIHEHPVTRLAIHGTTAKQQTKDILDLKLNMPYNILEIEQATRRLYTSTFFRENFKKVTVTPYIMPDGTIIAAFYLQAKRKTSVKVLLEDAREQNVYSQIQLHMPSAFENKAAVSATAGAAFRETVASYNLLFNYDTLSAANKSPYRYKAEFKYTDHSFSDFDFKDFFSDFILFYRLPRLLRAPVFFGMGYIFGMQDGDTAKQSISHQLHIASLNFFTDDSAYLLPGQVSQKVDVKLLYFLSQKQSYIKNEPLAFDARLQTSIDLTASVDLRLLLFAKSFPEHVPVLTHSLFYADYAIDSNRVYIFETAWMYKTGLLEIGPAGMAASLNAKKRYGGALISRVLFNSFELSARVGIITSNKKDNSEKNNDYFVHFQSSAVF